MIKKQTTSMDHYSLLNLSPGAHVSQEQIKKAYKKAALKYHPDRGGNPELFKALKNAYDEFMDPQKKRNYDIRMRKIIHQPKGERIERDLPLTLEQIYKGATLRFNIERTRICGNPSFTFCGQNKVVFCPACSGTGYIEHQRKFGNFMQKVRQPCKTCGKSGIVLAPGATSKKEKTTVQITVKPGTVKGTRMIISGESDEKPGKSPGDICFIVKEKDHPIFTQRKGSTLYTTMNITLKQALTSPKLSIQHLSGKSIDIQIPKNMPVTEKLILWLEKQGMPIQGTKTYGKLGVKFTVEYPKHITDKQQELLRNIL